MDIGKEHNKREEIINDLVNKRETIIPLIGEDAIECWDEIAKKYVSFQEYIVEKFHNKYRDVEVLDSELKVMKTGGYYGLSLLSEKYKGVEGGFTSAFAGFVYKDKIRKKLQKDIKLKDVVLEFLVTFRFPKIITTICFDIIEQVIGEKVKGYLPVYYERLAKSASELPSKCIYHIFGQCADEKEWVYNEDNLLLFLLSHNHTDYKAVDLIEFIGKNRKRLFVLGCNLPNWLFRLIWYPTQSNSNLNDADGAHGYWIKNEKPEDSFENYLKNKKIRFSLDKDEKEEVWDILYKATERLQEIQKNEREEDDSLREMTTHFDVFISYASEDREIATGIFEKLKGMNINPWFDRRDDTITPGDLYWEKIESGIHRSDHFMPIITENWLKKMFEDTSLKKETIKADEWLHECEKNNNNNSLKKNYSIPVVIQGTIFNKKLIDGTKIECMAELGVLSEKLFKGVNMIDFNSKDYSDFANIKW